jgi:hypothetical protein
VLYPNRYQPDNGVGPGVVRLPTEQMHFDLLTEGPPGPAKITATLTDEPLSLYASGFREASKDIVAELSPQGEQALLTAAGLTPSDARRPAGPPPRLAIGEAHYRVQETCPTREERP